MDNISLFINLTSEEIDAVTLSHFAVLFSHVLAYVQ